MRRIHPISVLLTAALLAYAPSGSGQTTKDEIAQLRSELKALREEQARTRDELQKLREAVEHGMKSRPDRPAFQPRELAVADSPTLGSPDAPVTVFAYSDYQCPYCQRFSRSILPELMAQLIDTGRLRLVMREYPIERIHPQAMPAAKAALCAHRQGKYWDMHRLLFENRKQVTDESIRQSADAIGLNEEPFEACLSDPAIERQIQKDIAEADAMNVSGTPGFVLGKPSQADPDVVLGSIYLRGARPAAHFAAAIEKLENPDAND